MKYLALLFVPTILMPSILDAQVKINEVLYSASDDQIELKNFGTSSVDVSGWWFCSRFSYTQLSGMTIVSGSLNISPGAILALSGISLDDSSADLGLYTIGDFASSSAMEDYVQWGSSGQARESVAVGKDIWTAGDFVSTVDSGNSIEYDGDGNSSGDWDDQPIPTIGSEKEVPIPTAIGGSTWGAIKRAKR